MQNLYNVTKETITASDLPAYIDAGIHNNLKMVDVKYSQTVNGNEFLAFYFENENGDKVSKTEWPLRMDKPLEVMSEDERSLALYRIENQKGVVKQILEIYKPGFEIEASSFKEFAEKAVAFLGEDYKDVLVRTKVVYDYKGYTTLANDARTTFIESMAVSEEDSKIRILPKDKMERPKKDKEQSDENPLGVEENTDTKSDSKDEVPF